MFDLSLDRCARARTGGMFCLAAASLVSLTACVSTRPDDRFGAAAPIFSPQAFFVGRTFGDGMLRTVFASARRIQVDGVGRIEADGTLLLTQRIAQSGSPPRTRSWSLRPIEDGRFSGTLSDARGGIVGDVRGNLLHLRYSAKGGLRVEQWLHLQPGGQTALNHLVVRKFGLPVAELRETIRRIP